MVNDVYKIGLVSTHGTGKTNLARAVAHDVGINGIKTKQLPEVATEAFEEGITINKETTLEDQAWIFHKQCLLELKAEINNYRVIVCDRTVIDNYAYLANACGENEFYFNSVLGHMKEHAYSRLYLIPLTGELEEDGVRDAKDKEFQKRIYDKLGELLEKLSKEQGIPFERLPEPKPYDFRREEWTKIVVYQTLKDLGKNPGSNHF